MKLSDLYPVNFEEIFDQLPQGYLIIDPQTGVIQQINSAASKILAFPPEEITGKIYHSIFDPENASRISRAINELINSKSTSSTFEFIEINQTNLNLILSKINIHSLSAEENLLILLSLLPSEHENFMSLSLGNKSENSINSLDSESSIHHSEQESVSAISEIDTTLSLAVTDASGIVQLVSKSFLKLFEGSISIEIGKKLPIFQPGFKITPILELESILREKKTWTGKWLSPSLSGSGGVIQLSILPIPHTEGKVNHLLILAEKSHTSQPDYRKHEELSTMVGLALKVSRIGYWKLDEISRELTWSEGIETLFNLQPDKLGELNRLHHYIHPDDWHQLKQHIQQAFDTLEPFECTFRLTLPEHEMMWLHTYGIVTRDKQNNHKEIFAILSDITDRITYEQKLWNENQLRQLLVEMATTYINLPIDQVDAQTNWWLKKMGEFVKADRSYIFDYDFEKQICINTFEWCAEGIEPQIDNLQAVPLELIPEWVAAHKSGQSMIIFNVQAMPDVPLRKILDDQGIKSLISVPMMEGNQCVGFVGFDFVRNYYHVTETEQQLLMLYAQIFVNLRLRARFENEIKQAREAAESGDRLKTAFINNISHEIRTPLSTILGFGEYLLGSTLSEEEKKSYLHLLRSSTQRLIDTVNNYLDMAKLVSNNMEISINPFTVEEFLPEIIHETCQLCDKKDIRIGHSIDDRIRNIPINSDKTLIIKVLKHLLSNALKFTNQGEILVKCGFENNNLIFSVKDTGIGIPKEKIRSIFDMFTQGEISITRGYEGSGLGLTIAKGIIQLLGGKIWVESYVGKGSEFFFTIPLLPGSDYPAPAQKLPERKILKSSIDKPLILIADDLEENYKLISLILAKEGFTTLYARDGVEAVLLVKNNPQVLLVLMDLKMPRMSGAEAAKQIKELYPDLPVIFVTAYVGTPEDHLLREEGFHDVIPKPFSKQQLLAAIRKYIEW